MNVALSPDSPLLSVIIPAHNEEKQIGLTLTALVLALAELPVSSEILVVDDSSSDRTAEIAREHGAGVVRVEHRHIAATRNSGARAARGNWLIFLDADTRIRVEHLQEACAALQKGWSGGAYVDMDEPKGKLGDALLWTFTKLYFDLANLGAGCFLYMTRQTFDETGGFDEQYFAGEDAMLALALNRRGTFHLIENPVATSSRKASLYSPLKIALTVGRALLLGPLALKSRKGLELWYDGRR